MKRIVMFGPWCWSFLAIARSWRRHNVRPYLLELRPSRSRWRQYSSCLAGGSSISPDAVGTPGGIRSVHNYAASVKANAIVCLNNARMAWLARNRAVFEPECRLLIPSAEELQWAGSKRNQIELATRVGFDVLPSTYLLKVADCRKIPLHRYPVVLRPDRRWVAASAFKVKIAHSPAQLRDIVCTWGAVCGPLIAQPLYRLPNLVVHGVRSEAGETLAMKAFIVPRKFETFTLTIKATDFPPGLELRCRDFVEAAGITGCFHFDLLFAPHLNRTWFLEINVRLGGTTDKVLALGFNEPMLLLQAYGMNAEAGHQPCLNRRLAANKRALLRHMLWALSGRLTEIDYPFETRGREVLRSVRDLCVAKNSIFDWGDLRGAFWRSPRKG